MGGSPRFSIGNSAGNKLTWNGSTLAITGTLTSTAGTIGGWTIDSSGLRLGSGSTTRGMDTGSTAFYAGSATPGSAPFRVSTAGALVATNATITGAITATSGSFTGSITASSLSITGAASFSGGSLTLPNGGTITSSTLDLNSGTMSGLTIDGTLTMASGGKILLNSAGRIEDADGSYWDQDGITFIAPVGPGDVMLFKYSGWSSNRPYSYVQGAGSSSGSGLYIGTSYGNAVSYSNGALVTLDANSTVGIVDIMAAPTTPVISNGDVTAIRVYGHDTNTSAYIFTEVYGREITRHEYTNYAAKFGGRIYPGPESGSYQTARYINDNGTYMNLQGPINLGNATTGGSNANWSTFTVANIPDKTAAYVVVYVNGTAYRIPLYGNG